MGKIRILGTRGVPALHGGFETFAERLALYLVDRGWEVTVYCQEEGDGPIREDRWSGVRRVFVFSRFSGALGTVVFDWRSVRHAAQEDGLVLTLGYNTAAFCVRYRQRGLVNLINMDGIEWKRQKWRALERAWLYLNDWLGCLLGNHLIADHPEIARHLQTRVPADKITMIPYGADKVTAADAALLGEYALQPDQYAIVIARPEPENSILEIVEAFSRKPRGLKLALLGRYDPETTPYHRRVLDAASDEVMFLGPIYEKAKVDALRKFALLYIHGHSVGGTNPSLVEALGAGLPVLAHDNAFNRWVAGEEARYFSSTDSCAALFDALLSDSSLLSLMGAASSRRHLERFTWEQVLGDYESLFRPFLSSHTSTHANNLGDRAT